MATNDDADKYNLNVSEKEQGLCFIIGPIGAKGSETRKHADLLLNAVLKEVLENGEFGFRVKRADEDADPRMIADRVISDILRADVVVADLTDLNPNAFYELGIRHATLKPTIHVARTGTILPFDNVSHRTLFIDLADWHSIKEGREWLTQAVRTIQDPNFKVSNPITQANASFKLRDSADPRDTTIAALQERLSSLEKIVDRQIRNINDIAMVKSKQNLESLEHLEEEMAKLLGRTANK